MSSKTTQELLGARLEQLGRRMQELADKATETKERYEELSSLIGEMQESDIEEGLDKLEKRLQERFNENQDAIGELKRLQVRFEEIQELLEILGLDDGGDVPS